MLRIVRRVKTLYKERAINRQKQWPHYHGKKLVKLQLVERERFFPNEQATHNLQRGKEGKIMRTSIEYDRVLNGKTSSEKALVEGDAGIGKSTFCNTFAEEWANDKLYSQFQLLLLIPLREKKVALAESLLDLLKLLHPNTDVCTTVSEELEENCGSGILIVADGWDELSEANRSEGSFLYELLIEGCILPSASVILTSRPSASTPLHDLECFDRFVEVVGFNREGIEEYIHHDLAEDENRTKAFHLVEQLNNNPLIESICIVPLNCAIVCHLWRQLQEDLPPTMTGLYTKIILNTISRNLLKKFPEFKRLKSLTSFDTLPDALRPVWWNICAFAFQAIEKDQIVFPHDEVDSLTRDNDETVSCFGLLQSSESFLSEGVGRGMSFHFLHLTFQEYLAALHLVMQSHNTQLQVCKSYAESPRFEMVWRFFFGIGCRKYTNIRLGMHAPLQLEDGVISAFVNTCMDRARQHPLHRLLCHCSFEANSDVITSRVVQSLDANFSRVYPNNALDCAAVVHVVSNTRACHCMEINFSSCDLDDRKLTSLTKALAGKSGNVQVEKLHLSSNKLTDGSINDIFSNAGAAFRSLHVLSLSYNKIGVEGVKSIVSSCSSLEFLHLSYNPLEVTGIQGIEDAVRAGMLNNLISLSLAGSLTNDADINGALAATLVEALSIHCCNLRKFDISSNHLGVPGAQGVGTFMSQLTQNKNDFLLSLNATKLGDKGISVFTQSLDSACIFGTLNLRENNIRGYGVLSLADGITSGILTVKNLYLDDNPLGLEAVMPLGRIMSGSHSHLEWLSAVNCDLTTYKTDIDTHFVRLSISEIAQQLYGMRSNEKVKLFCLDHNSFSGESILVLAGLMYLCPGLESLYSTYCDITSDDLKNLLTELSQRQRCFSKLEWWHLGDNYIDNRGVIAVVDIRPTLFPSVYVHLNDNRGIGEDIKQMSEMRTTGEFLQGIDELCIDDLRTVQNVTWDCRIRWFNLGLKLGLHVSTLDVIREDNHHVADHCFAAMLKKWLKRMEPKPSWIALIKALNSQSVNYPKLAEELKKQSFKQHQTESNQSQKSKSLGKELTEETRVHMKRNEDSDTGYANNRKRSRSSSQSSSVSSPHTSPPPPKFGKISAGTERVSDGASSSKNSSSSDESGRILSDEDVATLVECLALNANKWNAIGLQLGFLPGELDNISGDITLLSRGHTACLTKMLQEWVQWTPQTRHKCYATEQALLKALCSCSVGLGTEAEKLKEILKDKLE